MPMFKFDRMYCKHSHKNNSIEWYFNGRQAEGTFGPFPNKEEAEQALEAFIKFNIEFSDDGGRSLKSNNHRHAMGSLQ